MYHYIHYLITTQHLFRISMEFNAVDKKKPSSSYIKIIAGFNFVHLYVYKLQNDIQQSTVA